MSEPLPGEPEDSRDLFLDSFGAISVFMGFVLVAYIWKVLFFLVVRTCLGLQRWKSLEKIEHCLDVHDHVQHNTYMRIPWGENGGRGQRGRSTFYSDGLNMDHFDLGEESRLGLQVDMVPEVVRLRSGRDPSINLYCG